MEPRSYTLLCYLQPISHHIALSCEGIWAGAFGHGVVENITEWGGTALA